MAGEENRVTVVIDGKNDAGGAFAAATAEAKAFQAAVDDANQASFRASRANLLGVESQLRAYRALKGAIDAVRQGENDLARIRDARTPGSEPFRNLLGGLSGGLLNGAINGGIGGLFGSGGALAGLFGGGGITSFLTSGGGIAAILAALSTGIGGIIPMLAAATAGVGAFGALAFPTFTKILAAVTGTGKAGRAAMNDLSAGQEKVAIDAKQLLGGFSQMAAKLAPSLTPLMLTLLQIGNKIMPMLLPLAQSAAKAIGVLLEGFNRFASSAGFKDFMKQMTQLAGPAIQVFGEGIGKIVVALGKLLLALMNPNMLRAAKYTFDGIAGVISFLANVITGFTQLAVLAFHKVAVVFDFLRHQAAADGHEIASQFDALRSAIATATVDAWHFIYNLGSNIGRWAADVGNFLLKALSYWRALPGQIMSALGSLPGLLFAAGRNAIQGLVNGILSMAGPVGSAISSIVGIVRNFLPGSPAKQGPLSGSGAPFATGMRLAADFAAGIRSGQAAAGGAMASLTGGAGRGGSGGGGVVRVQIEWAGPTAGGDEFMSWLRKQIRIRGGGNVQTALGRTN